MELKVIITLSNGVTIAVETDRSSYNQDLVTSILKDLASELSRLHSQNSLKDPKHTEARPFQVQPASNMDVDEESAHELANLENKFIEFCGSHSPIGDMRRLVVAAEGASKYLNVPEVSPHELNRLFRLASWPIPNDLLQSLRNSARRSFQWFQRVPGRQGYYSVTDKGRNEVMQRLS